MSPLAKLDKEKGEFRCGECGKLLVKIGPAPDSYEVKCGRCGEKNTILGRLIEHTIVTDTKGKILYANSVVEKATGYLISEVIGQTPSLWGGKTGEENYTRLLASVEQNKQPIMTTVTNTRKDGVVYQAAITVSPVLDSKNEIQFIVFMERCIDRETRNL
ncbi:MAG: PAS domain-containing protein [Patescibacteria group bacterium]|jgi:PAS domain S-box-containing protein